VLQIILWTMIKYHGFMHKRNNLILSTYIIPKEIIILLLIIIEFNST